MRRILLAAVLMVTGAWSYPDRPAPRHGRVDAELNAAIHDLGEADRLLRVGDVGAAERELAELRARLDAIRALVDESPVDQGPPPIGRELLERTMRRLSMTWNPQAKLDIVAQVAVGNAFTIAQVVQLAALFHDQRDRVRAIEILAPHVRDPEQYRRLDAVVFYPGGRSRIEQIFAHL